MAWCAMSSSAQTSGTKSRSIESSRLEVMRSAVEYVVYMLAPGLAVPDCGALPAGPIISYLSKSAHYKKWFPQLPCLALRLNRVNVEL